MKSIFDLFSLSAAIVLLTAGPTPAQTLNGTWRTEDGTSRIQFQPCGRALCGRIVWLREPIDPATGIPWRDKFNPDESLKRRPLLGLRIISELAPVGVDRWETNLYNPLDGKTYNGKLTDLGNGRLELEGCALAGLLCQTEIWTLAD
jgi:uncharacterized protein (DUF2147 family)